MAKQKPKATRPNPNRKSAKPAGKPKGERLKPKRPRTTKGKDGPNVKPKRYNNNTSSEITDAEQLMDARKVIDIDAKYKSKIAAKQKKYQKQKPKEKHTVFRNRIVETEASFDQDKRKEWLLGFSKRKAERKEKTREKYRAEAEQERKDARQARREVLRENLRKFEDRTDQLNTLPYKSSGSLSDDGSDEEEDEDGNIISKQYALEGDLTATTTVGPMILPGLGTNEEDEDE